MPQTIETTVYQFDELSDAAKERARDWYREASSGDSFWSEHILDEAPKLLAWCGFAIDTRKGTRSEPAIYWSGFASQGDGACFEGRWAPELLDVAALKAECPRTYKDEHGVEQISQGNAELWTIADESARLAALDPTDGISWRVKHSGHGHADYNTSFDYNDERENLGTANSPDPADIQDAHESNARDAMRWIYHQLEREYEYMNSDEQVDESIRANEYTFTEDGKRF